MPQTTDYQAVLDGVATLADSFLDHWKENADDGTKDERDEQAEAQKQHDANMTTLRALIEQHAALVEVARAGLALVTDPDAGEAEANAFEKLARDALAFLGTCDHCGAEAGERCAADCLTVTP